MAFWGVEIKPGKPFSHQFDASRGRLHISQATLGIGTSEKRSLVQCNVGDKSPVLLCSLLPDKTESCPLDLEYEEVDQVIFSVLGPRSVHLTGYYLQTGGGRAHGLDDESESYGEDIADTESDRCSDDEDEYEADFIDDDDEEAFSPPPEEKSKIVSSNGNRNHKRLKKKYQISDSDDDNEQQVIVKGSRGIWDSESEDEDILSISTLSKNKGASKNAEVKNKSDKEVAKGRKKGRNSDDQATRLKRKMENVAQDVETERSEKFKESSMPSTEMQPDGEEPKKKKKKRSRKGNTPETDENLPNDKSVDIDTEDVAGDDDQADVKKRKKKKKNKTPESGRNASIDEEKNGFVVVKDRKKKKKKGSD